MPCNIIFKMVHRDILLNFWLSYERYLPNQMMSLGQQYDIAGEDGRHGSRLHGDNTFPTKDMMHDVRGQGGTGEVTRIKPSRGRYSRHRTRRQQQAIDDDSLEGTFNIIIVEIACAISDFKRQLP